MSVDSAGCSVVEVVTIVIVGVVWGGGEWYGGGGGGEWCGGG